MARAPRRPGRLTRTRAPRAQVVFVRDPWSRLLSAYLNKFVQEPPERQRMWLEQLLRPLRATFPGSPTLAMYDDSDSDSGSAKPNGAAHADATAHPPPPALSFEAFVGILEESQRAVQHATRRARRGRLPPTNEHWAPQSEICALNGLRYDFVGRHAELPAEVRRPPAARRPPPTRAHTRLAATRTDVRGRGDAHLPLHHGHRPAAIPSSALLPIPHLPAVPTAVQARSLEAMLGYAATPPAGAQYGWEGNRNSSRLLSQYYTRALVSRVGQLYRDDVSAPLNGVSFSPREVFGAGY